VNPPSGHVKAGATFRVSGSDPTSQTWKVIFNGQTRTFVGKTFSTTLRAPATTRNETLTLTVTCNGQAGFFSTPFQISILAASLNGGGTGGHLPNTGGPSVWWLILAALAGTAGSTLMWRGRRRSRVRVAATAGKHALRR